MKLVNKAGRVVDIHPALKDYFIKHGFREYIDEKQEKKRGRPAKAEK